MTKKEIARKKQIDEMASKLFDYINIACASEKEIKSRNLELANSFLTAVVDIDKDIHVISAELKLILIDMYAKSILEIEKIKKGDNTNVVSEIREDRKEPFREEK